MMHTLQISNPIGYKLPKNKEPDERCYISLYSTGVMITDRKKFLSPLSVMHQIEHWEKWIYPSWNGENIDKMIH